MLTQDQVLATVAHLAHKVVVHEEKIAELTRQVDVRDEHELKLRNAYDAIKRLCDDQLVTIERLEAWKQRFTQAIPAAPVVVPETPQDALQLYPEPVRLADEEDGTDF